MASTSHQVQQQTADVEVVGSPSILDNMSHEKLKYVKGKNEKTFFYKIQKDKKQISCYNEVNSKKAKKKVDLKGAKISKDNLQNATDIKLLLKTGRVIVFDHMDSQQQEELENLVDVVNNKPIQPKKSMLRSVTNGLKYAARAPIKISSGTIWVLEKISDGFRKTPNAIFKGPENKKPKKAKKTPKGAAQGLYLGAESIVTEVFGAIAGLVTEPIKGGKKNGFKGVTSGIGRGIVGLVFKPVAGSIDLVTQTARGVGTVPRYIYKNIFKIKPKGAKANEKEVEKEHLQLVFEDEKGAVYVNKEALAGDVCLDPNELQDISTPQTKLTQIIGNIINHLDPNVQNQHVKEIPPGFDLENNAEQPDIDQEITKILNNNEEFIDSDEEDEEEIAEIFDSPDPKQAKRASAWSIKTDSFDDIPKEKFVILKFAEPKLAGTEKEIEESYHDRYAVNKGIPIDDSDEFDVDEMRPDEANVDMFLTMHTGRDGRNGPDCRYTNTKEIASPSPYMANILELLGDEKPINVEPDFIPERRGSRDGSEMTQENKRSMFMKMTSNISNRSSPEKRDASYFTSKDLDLNDMFQLIENPKKFGKKLKKWTYPEVLPDLVCKQLEDLPDLIRISDYKPCVEEYNRLEGKNLAEFLESWKCHENHDDVRFPYTHKNGGKIPENDIISKKMRAIGKDFIKKVGRTVLSGNFNLAAVPFPIKATIPRSYLENVGVTPSAYFPLYMNLAMRTTDPLERFKFYIVGTIAYFFLTSPFSKPFNPIIGETYTGHYKDGGKVFLEQISHHPPVSYMLYYGPNEAYKIWGPTMFSASAGLNTMKLTTKGWRKVIFNDTQQVISNTFPNEAYDGMFWGTNVAETVGDMEFVDNENNLYCKLNFGNVKKKPSDYISGTINVNGQAVSQVSGTCLGWVEIDGQRYFDFRYTQPFEMVQEKAPLLSDFRYRPDYLYLKNGHLESAQKNKDELEVLQRKDGKLRKEHKDKVAKGK